MQQTKRSQTDRTELTRKKLIEAAIFLVAEQGLANSNVVEICRKAEVTTGALQHQFGSKSGLMAAAVAELFTPFTRKIEPTPDATNVSLEVRIDTLIRRYWQIYSDPNYYAVIEILSATRHDAELDNIVSHFRGEQLVVLETFLPREFPDVVMSPYVMRDNVHAALDMMRGYAIRRLFETDHDLDDKTLDRAKVMILAAFKTSHASGVD